MNRMYTSVLALMMLGAAPAFAQQEGLITVNIQDVAQNIANDLTVDVSNIPVTVQLPASVAANVCDVDVNVLASQKNADGGGVCTAKSNNDALNKIVQKQIKKS